MKKSGWFEYFHFLFFLCHDVHITVYHQKKDASKHLSDLSVSERLNIEVILYSLGKLTVIVSLKKKKNEALVSLIGW